MARPVNVIRISLVQVIDELAVANVVGNTENYTAITRFCDLFDITIDPSRLSAANEKYAKLAQRLKSVKKR